jgi:hypothetical protein
MVLFDATLEHFVQPECSILLGVKAPSRCSQRAPSPGGQCHCGRGGHVYNVTYTPSTTGAPLVTLSENLKILKI